MPSDATFTRRFAIPPTVAGGPLEGVRVSIKALFDVAGHPTTAGTVVLGDPPATRDAMAVARLRAAGATLVGHTSMTELAYSGLGLNPHTGTPANPLRPGRIPGGSTSGGAVSVATDEADMALGTDTGGSLRIPAAFCGLVGFKPTQASVPRDGCVPLSRSLDSVGPIARDVATVAAGWRALSGAKAHGTAPARLIVPTGFGRDGLDDEVAAAFSRALDALRATDLTVEERALPVLDAYRRHPAWHYAAVESRAAHPQVWERRDRLDPRVAARMARADGVTAIDYARTLAQREVLIAAFGEALSGAALALPTVAVAPPRFDDLLDDADYDRLNLLCLRNTLVANVVDGCSVSLPIGRGSPVGLMLTMPGGSDAALLRLAAGAEPALRDA